LIENENGKTEYPIIDVHTHVFPEKVAAKAVAATGEYYGVQMYRSGTVDDLLESGSRIGVTKYIIHSSATIARQVRAINDYIFSVQASHPELIGFATLHPGLEDVQGEVDRIIGMGLRGIKLHPEFQNFAIDDEDMIPIYKAAEGRLPILFHMGDANRDSSSPVRLARIIDKFPELVVIAAHFGGYHMWDLSCRYLVGKRIYMDTSSSLAYISPEKATYMIRKHGADKMLFGSDYPMWDHKEELERFLRLQLTEDERRAVLFNNANRLLSGSVKKASDIHYNSLD